MTPFCAAALVLYLRDEHYSCCYYSIVENELSNGIIERFLSLAVEFFQSIVSAFSSALKNK